jgi:diaminopropionate ammonia-lyase
MSALTPEWYCRPLARDWRCEPPDRGAAAFHASLPGYLPTPLRDLPALAAELEVSRVFVKDESARLELAAFKVLGASWAVARVIADAAGLTASGAGPGGKDRPALTLDTVREAALRRGGELVTATDGNHGRAVAWMARRLALPARVFVPQVVSARARSVIAGEGAEVVVVAGSYDEAVERAASYAAQAPERVLVQDTAWPGYEQVPAWIVEGYDTLLSEIDAQLREHGLAGPDLVSVPTGVGSLLQAVVVHYRTGRTELAGPGPNPAGRAPSVLSVEPDTAACVLASLADSMPRSVPTGDTVMAGLNCGTPSSLAWPVLAAGLDAAVAVPDGAAIRAMDDLGRLGVPAGPSAASALAGARAALTGRGASRRRQELGVTSSSSIVLVSTEGRALADGRS